MGNKDKTSDGGAAPSQHRRRRKSKSKNGHESEPDPDSDSDIDEASTKLESRKKRISSKQSKSRTSSSSRKRSRDSDSYSSSSDYDSESASGSESDCSSYTDSSSEEERRRRRKERKKREEKRERLRKEKKRKRREESRKAKEKRKKEKSKKGKDKGKKGAVTNSWGKYGIIKETDMWNKRPEFTAWLAEVKQVNLESLPNWEEKQLFKDFMEDHNTATFPSKKYYDLDAYHRSKIEKAMKKGYSNVVDTERTVFNDEEQRRQELRKEREMLKEEKVEELKRSMQSGMAQAMKEQAQLREEMAYQYKLGNFEAAAAIQRRLDPDVAM